MIQISFFFPFSNMYHIETEPHLFPPLWDHQACSIEAAFLSGSFGSDPGQSALPATAAATTANHDHDQRTHHQPGSELRQHTEAEWDAMYPHIKRLYMTEHRRLREVVQLLRRDHGFSATCVRPYPSYAHPPVVFYFLFF